MFEVTPANSQHPAHVISAASGPLVKTTLYDLLTSDHIDFVLPFQKDLFTCIGNIFNRFDPTLGQPLAALRFENKWSAGYQV